MVVWEANSPCLVPLIFCMLCGCYSSTRIVGGKHYCYKKTKNMMFIESKRGGGSARTIARVKRATSDADLVAQDIARFAITLLQTAISTSEKVLATVVANPPSNNLTDCGMESAGKKRQGRRVFYAIRQAQGAHLSGNAGKEPELCAMDAQRDYV